VAFGRQGRKQKRTERSKLDATPPWDDRVRETPEPTSGPFDERDAPADDVVRADLGALRVPVGEGLDLSLEVNEAQQVVAATLNSPNGSLQLGVYAAPRNEGIWDDVRVALAESMRAQKGIATERPDGPWGVELTGTVPGERGRVPVRMAGIDGPRWLLRATFVGAAADPAKAQVLEDALRQVVVVRGNEPLPVGEPVPLTLPREVQLPGSEAADGAAN
jgi:Protein of unknown function (DUF3710)